jgi:hypothetical protein
MCLPADPISLLAEDMRNAVRVKLAVIAIVRNAMALNTLTVARSLYECKTSEQLSNEIFVAWAKKLLDLEALTSNSNMKAALDGLCLNSACTKGAAASLVAINQQLAAIEVRQFHWI